ncbi:MAG: hypothetical protein VCB07_07650 [Gammaproteobacteria bacterium]
MIYLTRVLVGACCVYFSMLLPAIGELKADEISVLYIGVTGSSVHLGARQGLAEANAQGEFMGIHYRLVSFDEVSNGGSTPVAIISAVNATRLLQLVEQNQNVPVFNTAVADPALRENCRDNLFHVGPSTAMLADAERQWQQKNPGSPARARTWHQTFRKYAAAQLNLRFKDRFGAEMDDGAWVGWAAMKLLSDKIVRQPAIAGEDLIEELKTNLAFDGQKGIDMSFRETGQLRQPLLLIDADEIVGEAPVHGVVDSSNLDSLGVPFCTE